MEIRPLTHEEREGVDDALAHAADALGKSAPLSAEDVQALYDAVLVNQSDSEMAQIVIGVAFGALFVANADYEWVRAVTEDGEETAVSPPGRQIVVHPIAMIQKRLAGQDAVDIAALCDQTISAVAHHAATGSIADR